MSKQELIEEFRNLPLDEKLELSNTFNEILNPMSIETEEGWLNEVQRRVKMYKDGEVETISYEAFFSED